MILVIGCVLGATTATGLESSTSTGIGTVEGQSAQNRSSGWEDAKVTPGERLDGVIGVQRTDIDGRLRVRALELSIEGSTGDERAAVVHAEVASIRALHSSTVGDNAQLRAAYRSGALSEGAYLAETAVILARFRAVVILAETVASAANDSGDDPELTADRASAIELARASRNAVRPGLRRSAAGIGVVGIGEPGSAVVDSATEDRPGVEDEAEVRALSALVAADGRVEAARRSVARAREELGDRNGTTAERRSLERALGELARATRSIEIAGRAYWAGNDEESIVFSENAIHSADRAVRHAENVTSAAPGSTEPARRPP